MTKAPRWSAPQQCKENFGFSFLNKKKTRCTSRYGRTTSLAFYELEYTNYVGNIIPHAITSLM